MAYPGVNAAAELVAVKTAAESRVTGDRAVGKFQRAGRLDAAACVGRIADKRAVTDAHCFVVNVRWLVENAAATEVANVIADRAVEDVHLADVEDAAAVSGSEVTVDCAAADV